MKNIRLVRLRIWRKTRRRRGKRSVTEMQCIYINPINEPTLSRFSMRRERKTRQPMPEKKAPNTMRKGLSNRAHLESRGGSWSYRGAVFHQGRKIINPSGGNPPEFHRKSTGFPPELLRFLSNERRAQGSKDLTKQQGLPSKYSF